MRPWLNWPLTRWRVLRRTPAPKAGLPWWGLILHSRDKRILKALLESGDRLRTLMGQPGWEDVEAVVQDWIVRYAHEAGRLGQQMEERQGQMVLRDVDTAEDDRRRLIACAQSAAIRGLRSELQQRSQVGEKFLKRQEDERAVRGTSEVESLV